MTRRPSFQFYPADWLGNTNLKRCSHEEKGAWIDFMCLAHDAEDYGIVRWPLREVAHALSCKQAIVKALVLKGVLKGADQGEMCAAFTYMPRSGGRVGPMVTLIPEQPGPLWYSSRMVRDEYVRKVRGAATRFTEGEDSLNPSPKGGFGVPFGDGSSSSSSSASVESLLRSTQEPQPGDGLKGDPVIVALPCKDGKCFYITQATLDKWKKAFPDVDPLAAAGRMKFWLEEKPDRLKTYSGMQRFFSHWLGKAQEEKAKPPAPPKGKTLTEADQDFMGQLDRMVG